MSNPRDDIHNNQSRFATVPDTVTQPPSTRTDEAVHAATTSSSILVCPRPNDIIMGRGAVQTRYEGNRRLRQLVSEHRGTYADCTTHRAKQRIVWAIVGTVQAQGGRFLKRVPDAATRDGSESNRTVGGPPRTGNKDDDDDDDDDPSPTSPRWIVVEDRKVIVDKVKQLLRDVDPATQFKRKLRKRKMYTKGSIGLVRTEDGSPPVVPDKNSTNDDGNHNHNKYMERREVETAHSMNGEPNHTQTMELSAQRINAATFFPSAHALPPMPSYSFSSPTGFVRNTLPSRWVETGPTNATTSTVHDNNTSLFIRQFTSNSVSPSMPVPFYLYPPPPQGHPSNLSPSFSMTTLSNHTVTGLPIPSAQRHHVTVPWPTSAVRDLIPLLQNTTWDRPPVPMVSLVAETNPESMNHHHHHHSNPTTKDQTNTNLLTLAMLIHLQPHQTPRPGEDEIQS